MQINYRRLRHLSSWNQSVRFLSHDGCLGQKICFFAAYWDEVKKIYYSSDWYFTTVPVRIKGQTKVGTCRSKIHWLQDYVARRSPTHYYFGRISKHLNKQRQKFLCYRLSCILPRFSKSQNRFTRSHMNRKRVHGIPFTFQVNGTDLLLFIQLMGGSSLWSWLNCEQRQSWSLYGHHWQRHQPVWFHLK